jgi:ribosomal protein S18 acetylase RimI-like enzyme
VHSVIRPARATDTAQLLDLYRAEEQALTGIPRSTTADIRNLLTAPGLDLARTSAIRIENHRIQGLIMTHPAPQPHQTRVQLCAGRSDTARDLLRQAEAWPHERTTTLFQLPGSAATKPLTETGWQIVHSYTRLVANLGDVPRPQQHHKVGPGDPRTVHEVIEQAVAGHWHHQRRDFDDFLADQEQREGHDPALWLLAEHDGEPAGAIICRAPEDRAWIAWLGVLPAARGQGMAAALLGHAFAELGDRGHRTVGVDVDTHNETGAGRVYERAGMRSLGTADQWQRDREHCS